MTVPQNISTYPRQENVAMFYNDASILLNLSDKNRFIETFGLTALEAMSCALPVIVPTVGGISEMVENGVTGYKIDVQELDEIKQIIESVLSDKTLYEKLAENSLKNSKNYSEDNTINQIIKILDS